MKTSNRILFGFFILVFITPVFLFMGFRNKIKKGDFTVTKTNESYQNFNTGVIKPYKVVQLIGSEIQELVSFYIIPAALASYEYNNYGSRDSINLQQKGDTLLVKYVNADRQVNGNTTYGDHTNLNITLYLPVMNNIIVEGASVYIDSGRTVALNEIYFNLSKKAHLNLGMRGTINFSKPPFNSSNSVKSTGQLNKVIIRASDSYISFGMCAWMKDLNLNMFGTSSIAVDDQSRIDQLTGFISDSATVKANWNNIRRLAVLTGQ